MRGGRRGEGREEGARGGGVGAEGRGVGGCGNTWMNIKGRVDSVDGGEFKVE